MTVHAGGYIDHHFDSAPFTNGATFVTAVSNWQASTPSVVVVNTKSYSPNQSVFLPEVSALSNAVAQTGPSVVWTDVRIAPSLGCEPVSSATNAASFLCYCSTNGYLHVWNGDTWLACSNDVWDQAVPVLTSGVFATISIYQNFTAHRAAVLLNDQVVLQDLPFAGTATAYDSFFVRNEDNSAWLDDVYIQTNYDGTRLTHDRNGDGLVDGNELQTYGYVARTLNVGAGHPYASLAAALAVARDRDVIGLASGNYAETVTVTQKVTILGSITNSGAITVTAAGALVFSNNLALAGGGSVVVSGGRVAVPAAGVDMTGHFTLTDTWGTQATAGLDFNDDFELYAVDSQVQALGFRGWGASSTNVLVKAAQGYGSSKGVGLPPNETISNRIASAQTKIWTDLLVKPAPGQVPSVPDSTAMAFLSYVGSNGFLSVWSAGAWISCTNYIDGSAVTPMTTGAYARVTVFLDFTIHAAAVFVEGKLAREHVAFPAGAALSTYSRFLAGNEGATAYLDNVRITTSAPPDLTDDLDGDGRRDAQEIQEYGTLATYPQQVNLTPNVTVTEGNGGTTNALIAMTFSAASLSTVTVDYATSDGTATTNAVPGGSDYLAATGTITFLPGTTNQAVSIPVVGDVWNEADETFRVSFTNAVECVLGTTQAVVTIANDDALPVFDIGDASVLEGNSGVTAMVFTVTLTPASGRGTSVSYATANGTATAGSDYVATGGTLNFSAGLSSTTLTVNANGDTLYEGVETFVVNLGTPVNATVGLGTGVGSILDDDYAGTVFRFR